MNKIIYILCAITFIGCKPKQVALQQQQQSPQKQFADMHEIETPHGTVFLRFENSEQELFTTND